MTAGSADTKAQGLLNFLFGGGPSYPQQQYPGNQSGQTLTPGGRPYQFPSSAPSRRDEGESLSSYGKYRTLCVRTCDGYYFPISTSTSRKGFARDEARCQAACGADARLFHAPANQSTIDEAVDSDGRAYVVMKTAFLYRKKRIDSCQCRQAPWSEAEINRHRSYADAEAAEKARQPQQDITKIVAATAQPEGTAKPSRESASPSKTAITEETAAVPAADTVAASSLPTTASKPPTTTKRHDRPAIRVTGMKPPQGRGPVPVTISANAKPLSPAFASPMALGGSGMHWPGDPLPPATARKR